MIDSAYLKARYPGIITESFYTTYKDYLDLLISEAYNPVNGLDVGFWGDYLDIAVRLTVMSQLKKNPPNSSSGSNQPSGNITRRSVAGEYDITYASKGYIAANLKDYLANEFDSELAELAKQIGVIPVAYPETSYFGIEHNVYGYGNF